MCWCAPAITGLRAGRGPGIEFLEYLTPRNGRPALGIEPDDVAHWETTVTTLDADLAYRQLVKQRAFLISPAVIAFGSGTVNPAPDTGRGLLVKDPDGHAVKVVQR